MSKTYRMLTDKFDAKSDDGRVISISIHATMNEARTMGNPMASPVQIGQEARTTSEGHHCHRIDDDTWQIVELGITVKRIR